MSSLRPPGLGPIVGHTTHESCRLWIRASDPADRKADLADDRRTLGLLTVTAAGGVAVPVAERPVYYFRLRREYDRTGTFDLGIERGLAAQGQLYALRPDTEYTVRMATLSIDDPLPNDEDLEGAHLARRLPAPEAWRADFDDLPTEQSQATFRTFAAPGAVRRAAGFLLGSCRYPGILWKERESDQIFGPMQREAQGTSGRPPARFVFMVGDQIYADLLNRLVPIGRADTFEEFQQRYHAAFGSKEMRGLLRQVTTYMILDDHEIQDNWTQDRVGDEVGRTLFLQAIGAYMSYQWRHSPRNYNGRLFYDFLCDGYPFFILDTRTQRYVDDVGEDITDNHLLGRPSLSDDSEPSQIDVLLRWLSRQQKERGPVPKFIGSSSVFVPNSVATTRSLKHKLDDDSWPAFPTTREALLNHIVANRIQNVVFLSGDIHCSNVAEIGFSGSPEAAALKSASVTSSAFYWPFPFANGNPSDYVHDSTDPRTSDTFELAAGVKMDYRARGFTQEDNFCRIDIDQDTASLTVRVFDWQGKPVKSARGDDLISTLQLAPW